MRVSRLLFSRLDSPTFSFGYTYPNYDGLALSQALCQKEGWTLSKLRFYTGIPNPEDDGFWHHFWVAKLRVLSWQDCRVFSRSLRYRNKTLRLPDGTEHTFLTGEEKGIDVRIAVDVIRLAHRNEYDVALIFSQDQDLSEVADEIRLIAREQQMNSSGHECDPQSASNRLEISDWVNTRPASTDTR